MSEASEKSTAAGDLVSPAPQPAPAPSAPGPLREIIQPFVDLVHAPRALWGVNLAYALEGFAYFGILTYLAIHFSDFIFKGVPRADVWSHNMTSVLTAGIAIAMVVLGFVPDRFGARKSLIFAFVCLLMGRVLMSAAPTLFGLQPEGLWSALHLVTMGGILIITVGYGVYQPAAYSAVRQLTTPKTAAMGYAMLYALMNAGSSLAMGSFLLRDDKFAGLGIIGTFWVYTAVTAVSLLVTFFVLSKTTFEKAAARAKQESAAQSLASPDSPATAPGVAERAAEARPAGVPVTAHLVLAGVLAAILYKVPWPWGFVACGAVLLVPLIIALLPAKARAKAIAWIASHPLADTRFFVFIFALIPVQTLFTYNWLILPQYISRAYVGWIGNYFEIASNANPVLIFVLVPVITALTAKKNTYNMILAGTLVMAASAFILALGPTPETLLAYIVFMTIGEAMWSARFLQYATEIAPEGRAGQYQGVAQLPWFLTKFLVPLLYSGEIMERFCPAEGPKNTEAMWLIFALIAMVTPAFLLLAKGWLGKDFKAKAA